MPARYIPPGYEDFLCEPEDPRVVCPECHRRQHGLHRCEHCDANLMYAKRDNVEDIWDREWNQCDE